MAHMAAMGLHVHRDVLADSKSAPDGLEDVEAATQMVDELSNFFDAFISKGGKAASSVDVSTDSGSEQQQSCSEQQQSCSEEFTAPLIQERARLSIFQTVCG